MLGGTALAAGTVEVGDAQLVANQCVASSPTGYCTFTRGGGTAKVVDDQRAKAGTGYLRLDTPGTAGVSDKAYVFAQAFAGKKLSEITDLEYETYIEQVGTSNDKQAPAINIPILPNKNDASGTPLKFTTLVFEPLYTSATVTPGTWQRWSPSTTPSGSGGWWTSNSVTGPGTPNDYGFNTYTASFADVKAALPDAVIGAGIGPNQGGGNDGLRAGVDLLKVNDTTIDFDNPVVPTAIAATSGDKQTAEVGTPFAQPLAATVRGAGNAPAPSQDVTFTVTAGSATFAGSTTAKATTDDEGVATSPVLTAGGTAGPVTVTATSSTLTATFTETVAPAPVVPRQADLSAALTVPSSVRAGSSFPVTLTVRNAGPVDATRVVSGVTVPSGFRVTKATGGAVSRDGRSVGYLTPSVAAGRSQTFAVTVTADKAARGTPTLGAATGSQVRDPKLANNVTTARTTVVR